MNKKCLAGNVLLDEKIKIFHKNQNTDTYADVMKQMAETMQEDGHFIVLSAKEEAQKKETICNPYRLHIVDDCTYLIAFTSEKELKNEEGMFSESVERLIDFIFNMNTIAGMILNPWSPNSFLLSKAALQTMIDARGMEADPIKANALFHKAIHFAADKHAGAVRKGTTRPYIEHPLEVMMILNKMEADKNLLMAGLLHDTIEDTDATYMDIKNIFGRDGASLVAVHTKNPDFTWEQVRKHKIAELKVAGIRAKMLVLADMTANLRSMYKDYKKNGEQLWERFNAPKEKQTWYYGAMKDNLKELQGHDQTVETYLEMLNLYNAVFQS